MKRCIRGFTLIELVVTLSVIAILAALALPRYIALQTQARAAKAQAVYGGIKSAAALAHAQALATNTVTNGPASITMEGQSVDLIHGYPTANGTGIMAAMQIDLASDQVTLNGGGAGAGATLRIDMNGGTPPECSVFYTAPAAANTAPVFNIDTIQC